MNQDPLEPLSKAIADRVWAHLEERLTGHDGPRLISIPDAAARLGVKRTKVYDMIATGELPQKVIRKVGRRTLVISSELDRWIAAR